MKRSILFLSLFVLGHVSATPAGVAMSVDIDVVTQFKAVAMPLIINGINKVHIDELDQDHFEFKDMSLDFQQVDTKDVTIGLSAADNAIKFSAQNVAGTIKGTFKYQWLLLFCHGDFQLTIKQGGATIQASMPLIDQFYQNTMLPAITFDMFALQIDADLVDIDISGSLVADVVNLFIPLVKGFIIPSVVNSINDATPLLIESEINTLLYNSHGLIVLEKLGGLGVDFGYTAAPRVSDTQIDFFINATVFNNSFGIQVPADTIGDLLIDFGTFDTVQIDVSQYMVDSVFLTLQESNRLKIEIDNEMIPTASAMVLTTSSMEEFLPGLVAKYGEDMPMGIKVSSASTPKAIFLAGEMGANFEVDLDFIVEGQGSAVQMRFADIETMLEAALTDFRIFAKIDKATVGSVFVAQSEIGDMDVGGLKKFVNLTLKLAVPMINMLLANGIPFPHTIFNGHIEFSDATFTAFQDYIKVSLSPLLHF